MRYYQTSVSCLRALNGILVKNLKPIFKVSFEGNNEYKPKKFDQFIITHMLVGIAYLISNFKNILKRYL